MKSFGNAQQLAEVEGHPQGVVHDLGRTVQLPPLLLPVVRLLLSDAQCVQAGLLSGQHLLLPVVLDDLPAYFLVDLVDVSQFIVDSEEEDEGLRHVRLAGEVPLYVGLQVGQPLLLRLDLRSYLLPDQQGIALLRALFLQLVALGRKVPVRPFRPFYLFHRFGVSVDAVAGETGVAALWFIAFFDAVEVDVVLEFEAPVGGRVIIDAGTASDGLLLPPGDGLNLRTGGELGSGGEEVAVGSRLRQFRLVSRWNEGVLELSRLQPHRFLPIHGYTL
jgi:hypothetical protein